MSYDDANIDKRISTLTQDESFQETEKILEKLKNEIVDVDEKAQVTTLLNNLETLKTAESSEVTDQIDAIYKQLIQIKTLETFELTEEEINSITNLTETVAGFQTELFDLKEEISYNGGSPLDRNDDELDEDIDMKYMGNSPLDNKTRKPLIDIPEGSGKELFSQKQALKRGGISLATIVAGLSIRGLRKRRQKNKAEKAKTNTKTTENKENTKNKDNETKKKSKFWRRALGVLGIGGGVYAISKFRRGDWSFKELRDWIRGKEKGPDVDPVIENEEAAAKGFEDLMQDNTEIAKTKVKAYNSFGKNINNFSDDIHRFSDGSISKIAGIVKLGASKDKYPGAIPYVLDNTYDNIGEMNTQRSIFQLMAKANHKELISTIKERATQGLDEKDLLVRMVLKTLGDKTIKEFIDGDGNKVDENKVDEVNAVFQKILKVMAYANFAENAYALKQIKGKTIQKKSGIDADGDATRKTIDNSSSADKQADLIQDMLSKPEAYRVGSNGSYEDFETIREDFSDNKLVDVAALDITLSDIKTANQDIYEEVDKINIDRDKYHSKIENGHGPDVMETLKKSCEETLSEGLFASFTRAMPIATLLKLTGLGSEAELKQKYLKNSGFKKLVKSYKDRFDQSKNLKVNEQKVVVDEYLTLLKEINTTTASLQETADKNGSYRLTISSTFEHLIGNTKNAFTTGFYLGQEAFDAYDDGNYMEGTGKLAMGTFYVAGAGGVSLITLGTLRRMLSFNKRGTGMAKVGWKIAIAPIAIPAHIITKYGKAGTLHHRMSSYLHHGILAKTYKGEKLSNAMKNGLSFDKAYKTYASNGFKLKNNTNLSRDEFLKRVFDTKDGANDLLGKYLFDGDKPSKNSNAIWRKFRREFIDNTPEMGGKFTLTDAFVKKLKPLADKIDNPKVLQSLVLDRSIKDYAKLNTRLGKAENKEVLKLLNNKKQVKAAQSIAQELSVRIKVGEDINVDNIKKAFSAAAGGNPEVKKIKKLSEIETKLQGKLNDSIKGMDDRIKKTSSAKPSPSPEYIESLENHKKNLATMITNISDKTIDKKTVGIINDLIGKTNTKPAVQMKLIKHLSDDSSDIYKAIGQLKLKKNANTGQRTIVRLIGGGIELGDDFFSTLKNLHLTPALKKLLKGVSYLT